MNSELLLAFWQFMIVLIIFGSIPIFLASEEIKNNYLKNKMMKKISKIKDDGEFDYIYKQIRNSSEMEEVKKECRDNFRNFVCGTFCGVWAIIVLISPIFLGENFVILSTLLFLIFLIISVIFFNTSPNNKYKENVAKKLILATDPNIKYIDYLAWPSIVTELYSMAGYNDSASNRRYGTDYMEYTITRDVLVKLANLDLQCESHIRMGLGRGSRNRVKIFEGICAKIERNGNFTNNILIQRNKLFKKKKRIKISYNKFEKIFDLYVDDVKDKENVNKIVNEYVKEELINLYNEYGMTFEISLRRNNIYIRFFTGKLFEPQKFSLFVVSKKKIYKEYVILKSILAMITRINELFPDSDFLMGDKTL